jgi:DNA repair protein RadC
VARSGTIGAAWLGPPCHFGRNLSHYDVIQKELSGLRLRQSLATLIPAALIVLLVAADSPPSISVPLLIFMALAALPVVSFLLHHVWRAAFAGYRQWTDRSGQITAEIVQLRARVATIFEKYRERRKGEHFKAAYELAGKSVAELEEALAVGMFRERREVFVTAFMRAGVAVRVTASIGSPYKCAASDNPARWADHVERLGCDEVRQYHNHPVHKGDTRPSSTDFRTSRSLRRLLGLHGAKLRSLIICWNAIHEWKVFEHDDETRHWLWYEFDAAV